MPRATFLFACAIGYHSGKLVTTMNTVILASFVTCPGCDGRGEFHGPRGEQDDCHACKGVGVCDASELTEAAALDLMARAAFARQFDMPEAA